MPRQLSEIPLRQVIVDTTGAITLFFRLRWQELQAGFALTPTLANPGASAVQNAALPTTLVALIQQGGQYVIGLSLQRVTIDGAASSLQATWGWTQGGVPKTHVGRLLNVDTLAADPTDANFLITADANSNLEVTIAYTSTTPGNMTYTYTPAVLQLA